MNKLARSDLFSLEQYAAQRNEFRAKVMAHKKNRHVTIGAHVTLYFEDRLTMQYQIQEMLRAERIFEPSGIAEELDAYNPLIPDGDNWKATLMIEYENVNERRDALERLQGIEGRVWARVDNLAKVWAIADEDMDREDETKTAAVHFLRFQLPADAISAVKQGRDIGFGIDHPEYNYDVAPVPENIRKALAVDLT